MSDEKTLIIDDPETESMARQLAELTGEDIDEAVTRAIRKRHDRICGPAAPACAERLLQIGRECAAHLDEESKAVDVDDLLYDERGLPRED